MPNNNNNNNGKSPPPGKAPPRAGTISRSQGQPPPADLRRTQPVQRRSDSTPLDQEAPTGQGRLADLPDIILGKDGAETLGYDSSRPGAIPAPYFDQPESTDLTRERGTVVQKQPPKSRLEDLANAERSGAHIIRRDQIQGSPRTESHLVEAGKAVAQPREYQGEQTNARAPPLYTAPPPVVADLASVPNNTTGDGSNPQAIELSMSDLEMLSVEAPSPATPSLKPAAPSAKGPKPTVQPSYTFIHPALSRYEAFIKATAPADKATGLLTHLYEADAQIGRDYAAKIAKTDRTTPKPTLEARLPLELMDRLGKLATTDDLNRLYQARTEQPTDKPAQQQEPASTKYKYGLIGIVLGAAVAIGSMLAYSQIIKLKEPVQIYPKETPTHPSK
ncbi:MAG: hypothetical protein WC595_00920 [Candidatus Nanoarchaeia archaeon]